MYVPAAFTAPNDATLFDAIEAHGFATLVGQGEDGLVASHIPLMLDRSRGPKGTLIGHMARANPHARTLDGAEQLAIFHGPHAYVSPRWYEAHPSVPTWNYVAIHAYGRTRTITDKSALESVVARLSEKYEAGAEAPWRIGGLDRRWLDGMLNGIVGFEIEIARLDGKLKLSQNRSAVDRRAVVAALAASPRAEDRACAEAMRELAPPPLT